MKYVFANRAIFNSKGSRNRAAMMEEEEEVDVEEEVIKEVEVEKKVEVLEEVEEEGGTMVQYIKNHRENSYLLIHCPISEGVSEVSKPVNK